MTVATTVPVGSAPRSAQPDRQQRQQLVAVDDRAGRVDGQAPVGVTVVRQPQVGAVLDDSRLQALQVRRTAAVVDAGAVAVRGDGDDLRAGSPVQLGRGREAAPCAQSTTTFTPRERRGEGREQGVEVRARARRPPA